MKYSIRKRIISGFAAASLLLSSFMTSVTAFSEEQEIDNAAESIIKNATNTDAEKLCDEIEIPEEPFNEDETQDAQKENLEQSEIDNSEDQDSVNAETDADLYPVLSEKIGSVEFIIYSSNENSSLKFSDAKVDTDRDGLEVIKGYTFTSDSQTDTSSETLWVKAEADDKLAIEVDEAIAIYSIEGNVLGNVMFSDISGEDTLCEIGNDVSGIALVKDTGYRHINIELRPDDKDDSEMSMDKENTDKDEMQTASEDSQDFIKKIIKKDNSEEIVDAPSEEMIDTADTDKKNDNKASDKDENKVILDGMMPKDATARAIDVTKDYKSIRETVNASVSDASETDDALDNGTTIAAFDISIMNGDSEYQPDEEHPIDVVISDSRIVSGDNVELWHIKDDGSREQVTDFTVEDGKVSFAATGFSIYEIVQGPDQFFPQNVTDVTKLTGEGTDDGFYLYYGEGDGRKYFINTINGNSAFNEATNLSGASLWYFEEAGSGNFYIYTLVNGTKKYLYNLPNSNNISLNETNKTPLYISDTAGNYTAVNKLYMKKVDEDKWLQHSNGGKGIRFYAEATNVNNCQIGIIDAESTIIPHDPFKLDGKTTGLMYKNGVGGNALMADKPGNSLVVLANTVRSNTSGRTVYISEEDVTNWTFHAAEEDYYYISTETAGGTKYLKITSSGITLSDTADNSAKIKVTVDGNHRIQLSSNGKSIKFNGTSFTVGTSSVESWLDLIDVSNINVNDKVTYLAKKVSVSEVPDQSKVVVYTRVWDDSKKEYEFYAIDHDGTFHKCYDRGDNIMWIGSPISTFEWNFTEYTYDDGTPNNYYELQNVYSKLFIAPQVQGGQVLSDSKIGINMEGRADNKYYSPIVAWDDPNYAYAGLKAVKKGNKITLVSCPLGEAEDFYFASIQDAVPTLTEVETIDNSQYGITMKVIDFASRSVQSNFLGSDAGGDVKTTVAGLLSNNIPKGTDYPLTAFAAAVGSAKADTGYDPTKYVPNSSLGTLYSGAYEVNHLFIKSSYEATGYFEYDSTQNFASLEGGNQFKVYKELGSSDFKNSNSMKHGQFMPFNTITAGKYPNSNPQNLYDSLNNALPNDDPRKYEPLHLFNETPNYYNGVELKASFVQTPSGKDAWGHDIIFDFTGDDDFWLYVDNELVIDLGGIHSALKGTVNFATGEVNVNGVTKDLRQIFEANYRSRNPGATDTDVNNYLSKYFENNEKIFKDYTSHTMRVFYMERGAGASNLHMKFNLSYVTPGNVVLKKEVTGSDDLDFKLVEYPYQIWYKSEEDGQEKLLTRDDAHISVNYQNSTEKVKYMASYTPPNCSESFNSVFFLHPDKAAEIHFPSNAIMYRIIECGINQEVYDHVYVNDVEVPGQDIAGAAIIGTNRKFYDSGWISVAERPSVKFENHVNPANLRTLTFKKILVDENNQPLMMTDDSTLFSFRLYLSNGVDDTLSYARAAKYCVQSTDGFFCRWDSAQQQFVKTTYTQFSDFDALPADTDEQKAAKQAAKDSITFNTSFNGSISKIPAGYTVIVPNLPVGSKFKVEEKYNEIPVGYGRTQYLRADGTYYPDDDGAFMNAGRIRPNESPRVDITNKRGYGIQANKIWSDKKYTKSHDPIYFAVYVYDSDTKSETLLPDTVRVLKGQESTDLYVRYFFDGLLPGHTFDDYHVYEVNVTNPGTPDDDGKISSYTSVEKIERNTTTTINAVPLSSSTDTSKSFSYVVTYDRGTAYPCNPDFTYDNARIDTVTNTRSGGVVMNLYDMKTGNALGGGTFTLKKATEDKSLGTFVSDSDGRITILYDFEPDAEYILEETIAPKGYVGLPNKIKFTLDDHDILTVDPNGNDSQWQSGEQLINDPEKLIAKINVYNKPYNIRVYKYDKNIGENGGELEGATFALYKGVKSGLGGVIKNSTPLKGYESLVTGSDGIIPNIDNELEPGRYYLSEIIPPSGYKGVEGDVVFDITEIAGLKHVSSPVGSGVEVEERDSSDTFEYLLKIPNVKNGVNLTITKNVVGNMGNKAKEFTFTFAVDGDDGSTLYEWRKNDEQQTEPLKSGNTFKLMHGDNVVITVPAGSKVTISEDTEGYTSQFKYNSEDAETVETLTFQVLDDSTLTVTNSLSSIIPTGVGSLLFVLIAMAGGISAFIVLRIRRMRKLKKSLT